LRLRRIRETEIIRNTIRTYGPPPYGVAVVHGGPGAPGSVAPIARELARDFGVLEPLQTADSVDGQVRELKEQLESEAAPPVALIGHSWGAMLAFMLAARHPELVGRLILVASGPYEAKYAEGMMELRLSRLQSEERAEALAIHKRLGDPAIQEQDAYLARFGELMCKADTFDPLPREPEPEPLEVRLDINSKVWAEAAELRKRGAMLEMGRLIHCPVIAIHGDYDPHPAKGVQRPLSTALADFTFIPLEKCGHEPWREKHAREMFFEVLRRELCDFIRR
jgi:pimeloyl-ACP methyl ester carboxylesterase